MKLRLFAYKAIRTDSQ